MGAWKGWGATNNNNVPCSLQEVMNEQLAVQLQAEDMKHALINGGGGGASNENDTSNDLLIASLLQQEFDESHDKQLRREQDKWNGQSKVKLSFDNHRTVHPALRDETDFDESCFSVFSNADTTPQFNKFGISGKGKNIITKHDPIICARKNASKIVENFPPELETGDGTDFDMRLPNNVYNRLKVQSMIEIKRTNRYHEKKEHSTQLSALDMKTKVLLYKMQQSGLWNSLNGVISTGKESIVFHASGGRYLYCICVVLIMIIRLLSLLFRCDYVKGDLRFFKDEFKKQNPRKIMKIWAEKEELNLKRMQRFNLPCPEPLALKKHILVMTFIGESQVAAPKLSEAPLSLEQYHDAYSQCVDILTRMYKECKLVHADFSEFNTLWHRGVVYVIDVAQSVDHMHQKALEFLIRDCQNLTKFYTKRGVADVLTWQELFNNITDLNITGDGMDFIAQVGTFMILRS
ncbi:hypothetical protein HELRODRAFT_71489 [Helobdella robusta]|uniref:Serine/threonine-protein kinase RIO3 n=1 Tax=Helobdella robusta TaxID=6412 RepID=T1G0M2_HELRO|nr:hypothetical protein HELRODRAFT_71489 [Helobdella robusta]ESO11636.1 hypothetical protein HELRODRAFT_71489 [Helobdella robusta]